MILQVKTASAPTSQSFPPPISIVLIDDAGLDQAEVVDRIRALPGFHLVASSAEVAAALQTVCDSAPSIVLLHVGAKGDDRLTVAGALRSKAPRSRVIILGLRPADPNLMAFVRTGVAGFVMADASFERLLQTIRSVAGGADILPPQLTRALFVQLHRRARAARRFKTVALRQLSRRQQDVAALLGQGLTDGAIALRLEVALQTVENHVRTVLSVLAANRRIEVGTFSEG